MKDSTASSPRIRRAAGFTLIELLTVIAIIGILAAILIPTVGRVRTSANQSRCLSNQRQLALAALLYADANRGTLARTDYTTVERPMWFYQIRPFIGQTGVDANNVTSGRVTAVFQCPLDRERVDNQNSNRGGTLVVSYLHMLPFPHTNRENGNPITTLNRVTDPARHPMLIDARDVGSSHYNRNDRLQSILTTQGGVELGTLHENGANVAFYDGSVKNVKNPTWTTLRGFPN